MLEKLSVTTPRYYSSAMNLAERKGDLILEICRELGATTYLSGPFGRDYLDLASFEQAGIASSLFTTTNIRPYAQVYPDLDPHLSIVDLLLNHGPDSRRFSTGRARMIGEGPVPVVAAHPDDEVLGCGGTIARHAAAGDTVQILFLADGETSRAGAGQAQIARREEAAGRAASILGRSLRVFCGFPTTASTARHSSMW